MSDPIVDSVIPKLQRRIAQIVAQERPPGLAVGVVRDQELVLKQGFGMADIASGRAVDEDTLFLVASISKTFTATAIMQLRDEGKLRLRCVLVAVGPAQERRRAQQDGPNRGVGGEAVVPGNALELPEEAIWLVAERGGRGDQRYKNGEEHELTHRATRARG